MRVTLLGKSCLVGETINLATLLGTKRSPCQLLCWGNSYCVSYPVAGEKVTMLTDKITMYPASYPVERRKLSSGLPNVQINM